MRKVAIPLSLFVALAGVVGFLATGGLSGSDGIGGSGGGGGAARPAAADATLVPDQDVTGGGTSVTAFLGELPAIGPAIVKTADVSLVVEEGGFDDAFQDASLVAGSYGGFVESSATAGTDSRPGDLLIRIPSASFDLALKELRELGEVHAQSISGRDVTSQFVDLEARLLTWETQESVLLDLMSQATTIAGTLRVQRELQDVQLRIEQITGQLRVLRDQTEMSTIQVSLRERGAPVGGGGGRPSLVEAWDLALNGVLGVLYAVVVGLGYLVPIAALLGFGALVYRKLRPQTPPSRAC